MTEPDLTTADLIAELKLSNVQLRAELARTTEALASERERHERLWHAKEATDRMAGR